VYGGIFAAAWGLWVWQPYQFDIFPKQPPSQNPPIDPDAKLLFSPKARVLLVTAHPDDSAFYIGGFLTQLGRSGAQIYQVLCTDGDKGYYPFEDWRSNRAKRRIEAVNEAKEWNGRQLWFLSERDGRLKADETVINEIAAVIQQVKPDYIVCFDSEYPPRMSHNDHRRSG
jgi:LmbE family N-acetylglucosaminyl deacetylase